MLKVVGWMAAVLAVVLAVGSMSVLAASEGDYDTDDDGLIEVSYLEQLDAIRYDLDGEPIAHGSPAGHDRGGQVPEETMGTHGVAS